MMINWLTNHLVPRVDNDGHVVKEPQGGGAEHVEVAWFTVMIVADPDAV